MKPKISFHPDMPEAWRKKWLKENYPDCYDDFFPPEGVEEPSPKVDKTKLKGGKGGN